MLSKNIRLLRKRLGYSQEQVAKYLGITAAAVTQYESEARDIPAKTVSKLALLFNVDEYDLYEEEPQQQQILSAFAFRADTIAPEDLNTIAQFKKIVLNYHHLAKALKDA